MPKRLTIEEVRKVFSGYGYELLEQQYLNNRQVLKYRCPAHPRRQNSTSMASVSQKGIRCLQCHIDTTKVDYQKVVEGFSLRGYVLLSKEEDFKSNKSLLHYVCRKHPERVRRIRYNDLQSGGKGCSCCGKETSAGKRRLSYEEVNEVFERRGYTLISDTYLSTDSLLEYSCPSHSGIVLRTTHHDMAGGHGCPLCALESNKGSGSPSWRGGVMPLNEYLRKHLGDWKQESLSFHGFKCYITGLNEGDLEVHHVKPFHIIRDEVLSELGVALKKKIADYPEKELEAILTALKDRHDYLGVPLKKSLHEKFHSLYGNKATANDLEVFKARHLEGEFEILGGQAS